MQAYALNQEVTITAPAISGIITAICIRDVVTYEVAFWDGLTKRKEWLGEREFTCASPKKNISFGLDWSQWCP